MAEGRQGAVLTLVLAASVHCLQLCLSGEVCKYNSREKHRLLGRSVGFRERCRGEDKQQD